MVFLGLTACAHRVEVPVLAQPALSFPATEVAVVASQRDCQAAADEVVHAVAQTPGLTVSPRARVRLELVECGVRVARGAEDRRPVVGHAFAVVAVVIDDELWARLIATGEALDEAPGRRAYSAALRDLGADVVRQGDLNPTTVMRRYHPRARQSSWRHWHSQAVLAEARGDLEQARSCAAQAKLLRPTVERLRYLRDLDRRIAVTGSRMQERP